MRETKQESLARQLKELQAIHRDLYTAYTARAVSQKDLQARYDKLKKEFKEMGKPKNRNLEERVGDLEQAVRKLFTNHNVTQSDIAILRAKAGIITVPEKRDPPPAPQPALISKPTPPVPAPAVITPLLDAVPAVPPEVGAPA